MHFHLMETICLHIEYTIHEQDAVELEIQIAETNFIEW